MENEIRKIKEVLGRGRKTLEDEDLSRIFREISSQSIEHTVAEVMHRWRGLQLEVTDLSVREEETWKEGVSWEQVEEGRQRSKITMEGVGSLKVELYPHDLNRAAIAYLPNGTQLSSSSRTPVESLDKVLEQIKVRSLKQAQEGVRTYRNLCKALKKDRVITSRVSMLSQDEIANSIIEMCEPLYIRYVASESEKNKIILRGMYLQLSIFCTDKRNWRYYSASTAFDPVGYCVTCLYSTPSEALREGLLQLQTDLPPFIERDIEIYEGMARSFL